MSVDESPLDDRLSLEPHTTPRGYLIAPAVYGAILYLALAVVLAEEEPPPTAREGAAIIIVTGIVYWLAHVVAELIPRMASAGRIHPVDLRIATHRELPLLAALALPCFPLLLEGIGLIDLGTAYELAIWLTFGFLLALVLWLGRSAGLPWLRAIGMSCLVLPLAAAVAALKFAIH